MMNAIDVTVKTLFERLYLALSLSLDTEARDKEHFVVVVLVMTRENS